MKIIARKTKIGIFERLKNTILIIDYQVHSKLYLICEDCSKNNCDPVPIQNIINYHIFYDKTFWFESQQMHYDHMYTKYKVKNNVFISTCIHV